MPNKFLLSCLVLICSWQCKKYDDYSCEGSCFLKTPYIVNPTSYLLKSIVITSNGLPAGSSRFFYNKDHLIIKLIDSNIVYNPQTGSSDNRSYEIKTSTFLYDNGLCYQQERSHIITGYASNDYKASKTRQVFFYDAQNRVVKSEDHFDTGEISFEYFKYDLAGDLILWTDSIANTLEFSYYENHDMRQYERRDKCIKCPVGYFGPNDSSRFSAQVYDDKINFAKTINGLPPMLPDDYGAFGGFSTISPHNVIQDVYQFVASSGQQPETFIDKLRFTYNPEGLPIYEGADSLHEVFEYEKYK